MSAKRIAGSAIDWAKIAERVPEAQKPRFLQFKARSENYLRRVMVNPENPPKIDWAFYKAKVPVPGMVDSFQKKYETLQIPYPQDTVTPLIDAQEKEVKKEVAAFKDASSQRIKAYQAEIDNINSLLPFDQMTLEELSESCPEAALEPLTNPTFWPHNPEEQLGYKSDDAPKESSH
ncbi:ATP synthase subunit d, mitochondrial [Halyomorpha halys]|uniref:ATP synthase subunit d, mitochondrial n=1 Tax=Halyomorpha halys TaxID=286706 RepID=UPI0006D4E55E|nr:ATP synthase subunit d, mitochondrial [Halyomorpha halys]